MARAEDGSPVGLSVSTKSIAPGDIRVGAADTFLVLEVPEVTPRRRARSLVKVLSKGEITHVRFNWMLLTTIPLEDTVETR